LKRDLFQPAGSTPKPYKDFLSINEEEWQLVEKLRLVKPPGLCLQREEQAARRREKGRRSCVHQVETLTVGSHGVATLTEPLETQKKDL